MVGEMDWACVKEIRGVDRREDGRGGFVAYEASSGGGGGLENMGIAGEFGGRKNETYSLVVEIWKDHRVQVRRVVYTVSHDVLPHRDPHSVHMPDQAHQSSVDLCRIDNSNTRCYRQNPGCRWLSNDRFESSDRYGVGTRIMTKLPSAKLRTNLKCDRLRDTRINPTGFFLSLSHIVAVL